MDLVKNAGIVAIPLIFYSVLSLAIVLERFIALAQISRVEEAAFAALTRSRRAALSDPALSAAPVVVILTSLLPLSGSPPETIAQAADIALALQRVRLRRFLGTLATIGSTGPFVGLFGTVLGVMNAFKSMSMSGLSSDKMAGGISEALSATALGLLVAVPSVIAYNYFSGRVQVALLTVQGHVALSAPAVLRDSDALDEVSRLR